MRASDATRSRIRLLAACAVLTGLAMVQSPGLLISDTKFDLVTAPARFLSRSTHLWDAEGAFGQLQNQAYGYLWPMGPFFLAGDAVGLPAWVGQRLWLALVLVVALTGAARLARLLGVRSDLGCLVAGFAYALSPRMLTTLGPISIEAWPSALAPWVLVPLVAGATRGSPRRAAAGSALAVAMVGGVNAAATSAVLPLGVIWLLTRTPGVRRRTMMLWWPGFVLLGTLWWLIPLSVLGAYSPPFLDFIESSANTTFPTTLFDALRGTSNWVPYVDLSSRAGNDLLRQWFLVVNGGVLLLLGAAGLLSRRNPHRLFLVTGILTGLLLVSTGHLGSVQGWAAPDLQSMLDGVLAPLRNVHKFDPVVRLPLVLGLAFVVEEVARRLRDRSVGDTANRTETWARSFTGSVLVGALVVAVLGAALPAVNQRVAPSGAFLGVPGYWEETAAWLDGAEGTSLLVPGSSFGQYVWGAPEDEPMQSLARSDWAVRNAVPLTPAGNIRMLDAIEARFAQGEGSAGLTTYLRRAGISHLVVRNDLARSGDVPDPVLVHQAIAQTPGLTRARTFGPIVGGDARLRETADDSRVLVNAGWQTRYPAVEIFRVNDAPTVARTSTRLPVVVGGPEDLLDLSDLGVLDAEPTQLAADVAVDPDARGPLVLTDGLHDTERSFGRVHDGTSAVRVRGEARRLANRTRDYLLPRADRWSTHARLDGVAGISASSSMSDADAAGVVEPGELPYAAVDGDPATAWRAGFGSERSWWQVDFDGTRELRTVTLTGGPAERQVVQVVTDHVRTEPIILAPGATRTVTVSDPDAHRLRVEDVSGRSGTRLTLAEVDVPGLTVTRSLVLPTLPDSWGDPDTIALRAIRDARTGCVVVDGDARCVEGRDVASEEPTGFRRSLTLAAGGSWTPSLRVIPRPGTALDDLVAAGGFAAVTASSTGVADTRASALAAADGDLSTTWIASLSELRPQLDLSWVGERRVMGLRLSLDEDAPARLPNRVTLVHPGGRLTVDVAADGRARFPAITTDQLSVQVDEAEAATSLDFGSAGSNLPVGIGEVRLRGAPYFPLQPSGEPRVLPCGTGPTVNVGDRTWQTQLVASPAQLYAGGSLPAAVCGASTLPLTAGNNQVDVVGSPAFAAHSLVLSATSTAAASSTAPEQSAAMTTDGPVRASVRPAPGGGVLHLAQNVNAGWEAVQAGRRLDAMVVDGWQQGWRLDEGVDASAVVTLTFAPDRVYRWGLLLGFVGLLVLAALCCLPRRRWPGADRPCLEERELPRVLALALVGVVGGLLAGWTGLLVALMAAVVSWRAVGRVPDAAPWILAAAAVSPAVVAYALRPWGDSAGWAGDLGWPQLCVVALCGFMVGTLPSRPRGRRRSFKRMTGISTRR